MDIMKFITEQLSNPQTIQMLGNSIQAEPNKVQQATQLGIPALLQALNRNASTPQGAESLAKALDQHQDDKIEDINGFLGTIDSQDANKMLQHIFSGKTERVENTLARQTGLESSQVSGLLTQLAPLMMGALAQQKKQQNVAPTDLSGLLSGLTKQTTANTNSGLMGIITDLLDTDNDGSVVDEVGSLLQGFLRKK